MEKEERRLRTIIGVSLITIFILGIINFYMMEGMLPKYINVYTSLNKPLPTLTRIYLLVSECLHVNPLFYLLGIIGFFSCVLLAVTVKNKRAIAKLFVSIGAIFLVFIFLSYLAIKLPLILE